MESKGSKKKRPQQSAGDQSQQSKPHELAMGPGTVSGSKSGGFGPEMMLGLWTSWMEANSRSAHERTDQDRPASGVIHDDELGKILASEALQLNEGLQKDPLLGAIDQMWNANPFREVIPVDWAGIAVSLRIVWLRSMREPGATMTALAKLNAALWRAAFDVWSDAGNRWLGMAPADVGSAPPAADKRFAAPEWQTNPVYRTLKETYLLASDWLLRESDHLADMDEGERQRINFHLRQFVDAMSPSLLLISNPAALKRAMETGGASLAEGARNLARDLKNGRLSMVDETAFAPGRNLALTPGKVVHRNKLIELIQYASKTATVHEVPILFIPPWINKYYILDLQPRNSLIGYLVAQGFTVFVLSWKNPDSAMDGCTIGDYMDCGPLEASNVIREIIGSHTLNVMGYCIGGTLLAMTLAWLAAKDDHRFASATFMVSLQDFSKVGDTAIFMGESSVDFVEQQMMQHGYLDSREMANMFNLLRSNDLIWANVVNNFLLGNKPPAFDLLYWNSDGTRMARAAHTWYLHNTYVENNLIQPGKIQLKGEPLDLSRVKLDVYAAGAEKDHIVPWSGAWRITQLVGGKVRFALASSGHIAGIINPPGGKGTYWIGKEGASAATPEEWLRSATPHDGSWWTDWKAWLSERSGEMVKPPGMGSASHPALQEAPGSYVLEK
jgi:polyhydroxyalkanoate synthase